MNKKFITSYATIEEAKRVKRIEESIKNILAGTVLVLTTLMFIAAAGYSDTHYTMEGTVVSTSFNGSICIEDTTGNLWDMDNVGYCRGDKVRMTFFTDYTDTTREDDKITKIKRIK